MALLWYSGFEGVHSTSSSADWNDNGWHTPANSPFGSTGRSGTGRSMGFTINENVRCKYVLDTTGATTYVLGFAFKTNSSSTTGATHIFANQSSTNLDSTSSTLGFRLEHHDYYLKVIRRGSTVATLPITVNTWTYLEFKFKLGSSGSFEVRQDTVVVYTDSEPVNMGTENKFVIGSEDNTNSSSYFDDVYLLDTTGSTNNDYLGAVHIERLSPAGNGNSTELTPSAGSNFECVDEGNPNGDSDYVESSTVGAKDTYAMSDPVAVSGSVVAARYGFTARKSTIEGTIGITPIIRSGGTDYDQTNVSLTSTGYVLSSGEISIDPATSSTWTKAGIDAMEMGFKVTSS